MKTTLVRLLFDEISRPPQVVKRGNMWQDPILGYFESHGKMEFKPGEEYDLSEEDKKAVMERYEKKEMLKQRYIEQEFNPLRYRYVEGIVMDPALFRWYAATMDNLERFRFTPKTVLIGFGGILIFAYFHYRMLKGSEIDYNDLCEAGEYLWWDRRIRDYTVCASGNSGPIR